MIKDMKAGRADPQPEASENAETEGAPEKVGPGHPPRASRYKPGQSGNPKGRLKGSYNKATLRETAARVLLEPTVTTGPSGKGGKRRTISAFEAILQTLTQLGVKERDVGAAKFLVGVLVNLAEADAPPVAATETPEQDAIIIADALKAANDAS